MLGAPFQIGSSSTPSIFGGGDSLRGTSMPRTPGSSARAVQTASTHTTPAAAAHKLIGARCIALPAQRSCLAGSNGPREARSGRSLPASVRRLRPRILPEPRGALLDRRALLRQGARAPGAGPGRIRGTPRVDRSLLGLTLIS